MYFIFMKSGLEYSFKYIEEFPDKSPEGNYTLYSLIQTFFCSVKNFNASKPPSRPTPEFFIPPKGVRKSRKSQQLTQIIPLCSWAATRCARLRFSVQIIPASP